VLVLVKTWIIPEIHNLFGYVLVYYYIRTYLNSIVQQLYISVKLNRTFILTGCRDDIFKFLCVDVMVIVFLK